MTVLSCNPNEKGALFYLLFISLLISFCVFLGGELFVCFSAILFLSHSICGPSIVVIEHYWMETWIEGRIKGREERKEPRKWVKEQRGKKCQYVISPKDWTKREGRVPFSLSFSLGLCPPVQVTCVCLCMCVLVWAASPPQCTLALCYSAVLTLVYFWHAPVFPLDWNFNNQPLQYKSVCVSVRVSVYWGACVSKSMCIYVHV